MDPRFRNVQPEFLAALYDHAPIEIHVWKVDRDPEGMITSWTLVHANPQALRTWSRTLADVVGKSNEELFPGADTTRLFLPVVERIFSTSAPYEWEERFPETGQILKMTSIPLDDHFISCGVDVSDDRDVEAALSSTAIALDHSTRCLKIATEAAGIGIWEYLIGEESLVWDRSMYRIYGVEPTEDRIPYEVWRNGVHKDDIERATRDLNEAIASSKMFRSDFRIVRKDTGEVRYIAAQAIVEYDDDQQPVRMIGVNIDRTERRIAEQNVERLAFYDSLTDLPNRTLAERRLGRVIEEGARSGRWGALIFVDLDNFKQINDSVGHAVGDELLVAIAARLEGMTGPEHTAGRFGGDEFVVILDRIADDRNAASQHAEEFAGRLRQIIQEPVELSTGKQVASASIGVSVFSGAAAKAEDVFRQAELAMYQAKGAERGTVRLFDEQMEKDFVRRVAIERELETAIDQRSLELHYQPQVDRNGRIFGAEALVRWFHDELGAIPPNDFIRIAEESGQIRNLGRWILRTALHDLKTRFSPFVDDAFTVSVNVSAFQLYDPDFKEQFSADVLASGVRPSQLIIELTESALLRTEIDIIEKMHALKAIGIRFSLDDFGTGYSSLTRLKQLPIDELKIDQSFVRDITTNDDSRAIAGSVIALARSMKIGVIAEGVESEAHRQALEDMGCDQFQGYFCGRPVAADAFIEFLAGNAGNG